MSDIIKTLAEEPRKALVALACFRFLTPKQFVRLGVAASDTVMRDYVLNRLERRARPLAKAATLSRWLPKVHYLTKHGAEELATMYKLPLEEFRYPTGAVQFGERMAKHRFAQVDFHIGLRMWAATRGAQVGVSDMDFDVSGSRRGGNFEPLTSIEIRGSARPIIADGVFSASLNDTPILYALEIHRTTQTKQVYTQIKRYMDMLENGDLSFKYGVEFPAVVCSIHTLDNVLRGVKKHLMATPDFAAFKHLFYFNTTEQLAVDFSEGWEFADGEPADPFPKAQNPLPVQILEEPILPEDLDATA
jgi:hypothetical protein